MSERFMARLCWPLLLFVAATLVFLGLPELDLTIHRWLYLEQEARFTGQNQPWAHFASEILTPVLASLLGGAGLLALLLALFKTGALRRRLWQGGGLVALTLLIGSGLLVNEVFKNHWGRARPSQIEEFGGTRMYTPPLLRHTGPKACDRNCSFVSGDASVGFAFMALSFIVRRRRHLVLAGGVLAGGALGAVRMTQGAHFFSDVIFSGLVMYLTALAVHHLLVPECNRRP